MQRDPITAPEYRAFQEAYDFFNAELFGGELEVAQKMAGHSNAKTTGLYDRRNDEISLDEVERIAI